MKRIFIIFYLILLSCSLIAQITREEALKIVKTEILGDDTLKVNVYGSKAILSGKSTIATMNNSIVSPDISAWMFFIDDASFQNWSHPVRFVFIGGK